MFLCNFVFIFNEIDRIHWRQIGFIEWASCMQSLVPAARSGVPCPELGMVRVHPRSEPHSATGRVSLREPNLQAVARDFEVALDPPVTLSPRRAFVPFQGEPSGPLFPPLILQSIYLFLQNRLLPRREPVPRFLLSIPSHICAVSLLLSPCLVALLSKKLFFPPLPLGEAV